MAQLRERDAGLSKRLREAEDELKALKQNNEKRVGEVEAQRGREAEIHERRIIKLMSVIEALTTAGDERTDMRVLAEKMNQLREVNRVCIIGTCTCACACTCTCSTRRNAVLWLVFAAQVRELLEDEKAMVRSFQKHHRHAGAAEATAEREKARRRISELEAEVKLARSMAETQVDEVSWPLSFQKEITAAPVFTPPYTPIPPFQVSSAHAAELSAVQRRLSEMEEEKAALKHSFEQRLADEKGQQYGDAQERERRRLSVEESFKAQLAEARREISEAQAATQAANSRVATLIAQTQSQQKELLLAQQQVQQLQVHAAHSISAALPHTFHLIFPTARFPVALSCHITVLATVPRGTAPHSGFSGADAQPAAAIS